MVDICGKPHLEHQVNLAKEYGFDHIIFSAGYLHESIMEYFGDGSEFGVDIEYVLDGDKPLGTAGAIKNCAKHVRSSDFLVMNGDILTDISLDELFESHLDSGCKITITLVPVKEPSRFGVVLTDDIGRVTDFLEKPKNPPSNYINAGLYVMNAKIFKDIPSDTYFMVETDVFPQGAKAGTVNSYKSDRYWRDIGTPESYFDAFHDIWNTQVIIPGLDLPLISKEPPKFVGDTWEGVMGKDFTFVKFINLAEAIKKEFYGNIYIEHDDRFFSDNYHYVLESSIGMMARGHKDSKLHIYIGSSNSDPAYNSVRIKAEPKILEAIKNRL